MKNLTGCQSYNQSIQLKWNKGKLQFSKKYSFVLTLNCKITIKFVIHLLPFCTCFIDFFLILYRSYAQKFVFQLEVIIISITNAFLMQLISILPQWFECWFMCKYENFGNRKNSVTWEILLKAQTWAAILNSCLPI